MNQENNFNRPQDKFDQPDSIAVSIILSLITFGIYALYWYYKMMVKIDRLHPRSQQSYGVCIVCIMFVPFYFLYWIFNRSKLIAEAGAYRRISNGDNSVINLLLAIFGFSIVSVAIMQNDLNNIQNGFNRFEDDYSVAGNSQ